jgi:aspartyl protease family protein
MDDLTREDWIQIVVYGAFGLFLALSIPRLFRGRIVAGLAALTFWAFLLGIVLTGYAYRFELQSVGQRVMAVMFPGTVVETAPHEVTVFRRPDGQFDVAGTVGTTRVGFVLDTGASTIVLRAEDARRLGLPIGKLVYDIPVSTANGHALTAAVVLPELRIGGIVERDVDALVAKAGALHENLLGMTFLNRLASFTFSNDRLVLRGQ